MNCSKRASKESNAASSEVVSSRNSPRGELPAYLAENVIACSRRIEAFEWSASSEENPLSVLRPERNFETVPSPPSPRGELNRSWYSGSDRYSAQR
jgi:hypothetical protein